LLNQRDVGVQRFRERADIGGEEAAQLGAVQLVEAGARESRLAGGHRRRVLKPLLDEGEGGPELREGDALSRLHADCLVEEGVDGAPVTAGGGSELFDQPVEPLSGQVLGQERHRLADPARHAQGARRPLAALPADVARALRAQAVGVGVRGPAEGGRGEFLASLAPQ
jgi:hypothetical protein